MTKVCSSIVYTAEHTLKLVENLPSPGVFTWCQKNGYVIIPAPPTPMSTLDVRENQSAYFYSKKGGWYADQRFALEDKTPFGWLLIRKTPAENSIGKDWGDQIKLIRPRSLEYVPNAAEMCWFITIYFAVRGSRLFQNCCGRTSSTDSLKGHICVGNFDPTLRVLYEWGEDGPPVNLGLSVARKVKGP